MQVHVLLVIPGKINDIAVCTRLIWTSNFKQSNVVYMYKALCLNIHIKTQISLFKFDVKRFEVDKTKLFAL